MWAAAGESPSRAPACGDVCVATPGGSGLGAGRAPGSRGVWGWVVLWLQVKMYLISEGWRCSIAPRSIFLITG